MSDTAKRKEYAKEAERRVFILIKKIKDGDFDTKIYKRYDVSDEDEEYPEDSDAFEDVIEWFNENIRGLIAESNYDPKKTVDSQETSTNLRISQYKKKLEKVLTDREEDIYDTLLEKKKAERAKAEKAKKSLESTIKNLPNKHLDKDHDMAWIEKLFKAYIPKMRDFYDSEEIESLIKRTLDAFKERQAKQKYEYKREENAYRRANIYDIQLKTRIKPKFVGKNSAE